MQGLTKWAAYANSVILINVKFINIFERHTKVIFLAVLEENNKGNIYKYPQISGFDLERCG